VKKDRSFRLRGRMFEAPVALIDRSIELRFHEESPSQVEIFFEAMSFGQAALLDPHVNAKLGRNWMTREKKRSEPDRGPSPDAGLPVLKSGTLPLGSSSSISSQGDES
jgi:hypothetical protein